MEKRNPWVTLGTRETYRNAWIRVREDKVIRPDGEEGIYGVVEISPSVGVVAVDEGGEVTLVGQWRYVHNKYSWEIPTGAKGPGEDPLEGAKRELVEEAGIIAEEWYPMGSIDNSNGVTTDVGHLFLAKKLKITTPAPSPFEQIAIKKVKFADVVAKVMKGEITESLSVAAILKADKLVSSGLIKL